MTHLRTQVTPSHQLEWIDIDAADHEGEFPSISALENLCAQVARQ